MSGLHVGIIVHKGNASANISASIIRWVYILRFGKRKEVRLLDIVIIIHEYNGMDILSVVIVLLYRGAASDGFQGTYFYRFLYLPSPPPLSILSLPIHPSIHLPNFTR